ncbi:hypothetical protein NPX13_g1940 [Xylaria arbuscula]|uniref:Major facilitator superfamily (MFS) profile domain-containing protein n=1 Tax=Xylaria arbuscula TaxID=114810 RepID=A0A9W8NKJ5_9PEZI|nr:hypothetical protein NPX13_g1940 [Xylaria arbuscula]
MKNFIKQTALIRPPPSAALDYNAVSTSDEDADASLSKPVRPPNVKYVYGLTCFVSLGAFLFGWDQGVMAMIIADDRWLELMQPANDWSVGFVVSIYNIGCVIGALTIGVFADACGRERTISLASTVFIIGALLQAASYTIAQIERYECALEVLTRLHGSAVAEEEIRVIRETVQGEVSVKDRAGTSWADMFRGSVLRVTLLGMGIQMFQQTTGTNGIFYYAPKLFKKGGITDPKLANLATGGIGVTLFLSSWIPVFYFDRYGRRTWFQIGLVGMIVALTGICIFQQHAADYPHSPINYAIVVFPYLFFTFFNASWSSGSWTYAAEIFSLPLRAKGNALCTASLWISNFLVAQVSPPIESATGYGLYILFIIICVIAFFFVRFALVETKGRSLEEMAELFGIDEVDVKDEEERGTVTQGLLRTTSGDDDFVDD